MKAISLWQPWATLWLLSDPDEKVYETRGWPTYYRGPLLVHAAKTRNAEVRAMLACPLVVERLAAHGLTVEDLAFGALIGEVWLMGCRRMDGIELPGVREQAFGNWAPERYAWKRDAHPKLYQTPIPYKGKQGFFEVPNQIIPVCPPGGQKEER